jgi:haloacid dehalogenase-like hydrolase
MPNGVLMFRRCGLSIAMGNASDEVQAQASDVTDSYNNEGFAKAVEIGDLLAYISVALLQDNKPGHNIMRRESDESHPKAS